MPSSVTICICGGGSLGHVLAAVLGKNSQVLVRLLTSQPDRWNKQIEVNYRNIGVLHGTIDRVSNDPSKVLIGADVVIITAPSFAYHNIWNLIKPYVSEYTIIGALPGSGGFDWITHNHKGIIFGMQRTPYVSRTIEYGKQVFVSGVRKEVFIGTRPATSAHEIAQLLSPLLDINVYPLANYLTSSLAPANAILHSVRNYSLFHQVRATGIFEKPLLYYEDWDDLASSLFLSCDQEIQALYSQLPLDLSAISSIRDYYGVHSIDQLTRVIRSIESLKGIQAPLTNYKGKFYIDLHHRFFREDMLVNLPIFAFFANMVGINLPVINSLLDWISRIYRIDRKAIDAPLKHLANEAGIGNLSSLVRFYE